MTTIQLTGGSVKHVVPSNYAEGKQGAEVTLHYTAAEGASHADIVAFHHQTAELAKASALSMARGQAQPAETARVAPAALPPAPVAPVAPPVTATPLPAQAVPVAVPLPATAVATVSPIEVPWDDRTITEHLTKAAARLAPVHGEAGPEKLRTLIRQFLPEGSLPKAGLIAPEHRVTFLQHLEALQ